MKMQKSILFVYTHWQSFVREDYDILSDGFKVLKLHFRLEKGLFSFIYHQFSGIFSILHHILKVEVIYIWFCDYHAFWAVLLAKIFNKKTVIVVGGFDAVKIPSIEYGLFMKNNLRTHLVQFAYRHCDKIIAVDESLIHGKNTYAGADSITGVAHFVKGISGKSQVIPTGYDAEKWKVFTKKNQVLTVALIKDEKVFARKGIDLFLATAQQLPHIEFYLVGLQDMNLIPDEFKELQNLRIFPILNQEELIELYAESKVYVQFSVSEGLPNVLCEAMMSACIPVGTTANGIPHAIGDCGFILHQKDINQAVKLVESALKSPTEMGTNARQRIQKLFPKQKRKKLLFELINKL
ncbi:MAG: glycosyltransferase family 4 protein [Flavobacteriaceae bacterium]|nr:glycosyltransferase family 4 protein [Flavobacteriaceae bacterium]